MKYIVMPITDAKLIFTEDELSHMRKSVDETEVIVHENILIEKRNIAGMVTLPSEETGQIEWTYPNYKYNSEELNNLLSSSKWNSDTTENVQTLNVASSKKSTTSSTKTTVTRLTSKTTNKKVDKSYWNF